MTDNEEPIRLEASDSVRAAFPDAEKIESSGEGITYLMKEYEGFNSEALEAILLNIQEMSTKALEMFREADKDHVKLNLVGSVLYSLAEMYNRNIETLKHWHDLVCTLPKLTAELNEELSALLGRPVDIDAVPEAEVDSLFNEVLQKQSGDDLDKLREVIERKNRES